MFTDKLDIFIEVAEALSFSSVAKKHYLTQPAISRQITSIEEELNIPLFVRTNKGLRLTPEGTIILKHCKKAQLEIKYGISLAQDIRTSHKGQLKAGILSTFDFKNILQPYFHSFSLEHPGVDLSIYRASFGLLRDFLEKDTVDLVYTLDFDLQNYPHNITYNVVREVTPLLVLSENHPLFSKSDLSVSDCKNETFIVPEDDDSPGRETDMRNLLQAYDIPVCKIRTAPNIPSVELQVSLGNGIGISDNSSAIAFDPHFRCLPFATHDNPQIVAVWKKNNLNPILPMFINEQDIGMKYSKS